VLGVVNSSSVSRVASQREIGSYALRLLLRAHVHPDKPKDRVELDNFDAATDDERSRKINDVLIGSASVDVRRRVADVLEAGTGPTDLNDANHKWVGRRRTCAGGDHEQHQKRDQDSKPAKRHPSNARNQQSPWTSPG